MIIITTKYILEPEVRISKMKTKPVLPQTLGRDAIGSPVLTNIYTV